MLLTLKWHGPISELFFRTGKGTPHALFSCFPVWKNPDTDQTKKEPDKQFKKLTCAFVFLAWISELAVQYFLQLVA